MRAIVAALCALNVGVGMSSILVGETQIEMSATDMSVSHSFSCETVVISGIAFV
jgi:hypothetical protein